MIQESLVQVQSCTVSCAQELIGPHCSTGEGDKLPYQEWSKRALLGYYKLLLSKQADMGETGMWKHTENSAGLYMRHPLSQNVIEFSVTVVAPKYVGHEWPTCQWVIDMHIVMHCQHWSHTSTFSSIYPILFSQSSKEIKLDTSLYIFTENFPEVYFFMKQHFCRCSILWELKNTHMDIMNRAYS